MSLLSLLFPVELVLFVSYSLTTWEALSYYSAYVFVNEVLLLQITVVSKWAGCGSSLEVNLFLLENLALIV